MWLIKYKYAWMMNSTQIGQSKAILHTSNVAKSLAEILMQSNTVSEVRIRRIS